MTKIYAAIIIAALVGLGVAAAYVLRLERTNALQDVQNQNTKMGDSSDDARARFDACPRRELWDAKHLRCRNEP